jgi:hypothetical protein
MSTPPPSFPPSFSVEDVRDGKDDSSNPDSQTESDVDVNSEEQLAAALLLEETSKVILTATRTRNAHLRQQAIQAQIDAEIAEGNLISVIIEQIKQAGAPLPVLPLSLSSSLLTPARAPAPLSAASRTLVYSPIPPAPLSSQYKGQSEESKRRQERLNALPFVTAPPPPPPPPPPSSDHLPHHHHTRVPLPGKFSGADAAQNTRVSGWTNEVDAFFAADQTVVSRQYLIACTLLTDKASDWRVILEKTASYQGKALDWSYLKEELILRWGQTGGVAASRAQWKGLHMGQRNVDGSTTGGKATYTVTDYTATFNRLMAVVSPHQRPDTTEASIIDRYVDGIQMGYPALYEQMKGNKAILEFETLAQAIEGAEVAESNIDIAKSLLPRSAASSQPWQRAGSRSSTQANHIHSDGCCEGESETSTSSSPSSSGRGKEGSVRVNQFTFRPSKDDGRYKLTEVEARKLWDEHRCFQCYEVHPKLGRCGKKMMTAPRPLN